MKDSLFHTANVLTVPCTAFGSVTFPTVIWLSMIQPKTAIDTKLYSSISLSVMDTAVGCDNHCQITVGNKTQPMTVNIWNVVLKGLDRLCLPTYHNSNSFIRKEA